MVSINGKTGGLRFSLWEVIKLIVILGTIIGSIYAFTSGQAIKDSSQDYEIRTVKTMAIHNTDMIDKMQLQREIDRELWLKISKQIDSLIIVSQ